MVCSTVEELFTCGSSTLELYSFFRPPFGHDCSMLLAKLNVLAKEKTKCVTLVALGRWRERREREGKGMRKVTMKKYLSLTFSRQWTWADLQSKVFIFFFYVFLFLPCKEKSAFKNNEVWTFDQEKWSEGIKESAYLWQEILICYSNKNLEVNG